MLFIPGAEEIDPVEPSFNYNGAGHVMGSCGWDRTSTTQWSTVRVAHTSTENLYVLGASVFATGSTANATLTVAALSLRTTEAISNDLASLH